MPVYDWECQDCGNEYDELSRYDETGEYPGVICPKCKSAKKIKLISRPAEAVFLQPEGTSKWNRSHDLRYYKKLEKDRQNRELAEKTSHMGEKPYNDIDDISSGKYFGEIK